jgi:hypothetical protein
MVDLGQKKVELSTFFYVQTFTLKKSCRKFRQLAQSKTYAEV